MSDKAEKQESAGAGAQLADAIRDVKNAAADRDDVVVELREASRMRLDLLAAELAPVFADVPADIDLFDFTISSGLQPRLWIDAVSHVAMGARPPDLPFPEGHARRPRRARRIASDQAGRRPGRALCRRAASSSASA